MELFEEDPLATPLRQRTHHSATTSSTLTPPKPCASSRGPASLVYAKNAETWKKKLPLLPQEGEKYGSWLSSSSKPSFGMGCIACKGTNQDNPYARFEATHASLYFLKRHANSKCHTNAVCKLLGERPRYGRRPPTREEFETVLKDRRDIKSFKRSTRDMDGPKAAKAKRMTWCLSEVLLDRDRKV